MATTTSRSPAEGLKVGLSCRCAARCINICTKDNVRVAIRARPLLATEKLRDSQSCCKFDKVYQVSVVPLVAACFEGYNATVLAYGQTGSGKTYTMGSGNKRNLDDEKVGIIPRVVREVFRLTKEKGEQRVEVRVSYLEIYNELLRDLLHPRSSSGKPVPISIREGPNSAIQLVGIKEEPVSNYSEMMRYLERGSVSRTTASTLMNSYSSRSHSIFTITIVQNVVKITAEHISRQRAGKNKQKRKYKKSKFHLVDLAGSERAKRTGAVGARFKESITINKGLLALGNVISALCASQAKRTHIPYRNSKLTRLLQDSLGGNSRTLMIACISPADINFEESLTTLKYADRAKKIKNRVPISQ
eukprot:jgi/Bigna1/57911/fgenesh1_pm.37_\